MVVDVIRDMTQDADDDDVRVVSSEWRWFSAAGVPVLLFLSSVVPCSLFQFKNFYRILTAVDYGTLIR